jgi:hypothetical protein
MIHWDDWQLMRDHVKNKVARKKFQADGEQCHVCKEFVLWAQINCLSKNDKVFVCFPCRTSEVNKVVYEIQEITDE